MNSRSSQGFYGWLDSFAVAMSLICAVHCLLTPLLVVLLPIVATSFWVHEQFHLWMILLVVPTTGTAIFMGCKKHRDRLVFLLSVLGLIILTAVAVYETLAHSGLLLHGHAHCAHCVEEHSHSFPPISTMINVFGGLLVAAAHVRNYLLCRSFRCTHE